MTFQIDIQDLSFEEAENLMMNKKVIDEKSRATFLGGHLVVNASDREEETTMHQSISSFQSQMIQALSAEHHQ